MRGSGAEMTALRQTAGGIDEGSITCDICPHACRLANGQTGICRARREKNGAVVSVNYGKLTSIALDPIEKKPLAFYRPGTSVLSIGSFGCNMRCPFCQNASIAQAGIDDVAWREFTPEQIVDQAVRERPNGCIGVAYTYNEPCVGFEFVRDCSRLAHGSGLVNVLVSNGMISNAPLSDVAPLIDAANIDLKCFTEEGYRRLGGDLSCVKGTIAALVDAGVHVEVTTLVVPGLNDDEAEIDDLTAWLASLDRDMPYHLTRFFPAYRMRDVAPTPIRTLLRLRDVAQRHLNRVVLGNV